MDLTTITPLLITKDELPNLDRALAPLKWAKQLIVVDSGSTDGTLELLRRDARIQLVERPFDSFAGQCNAGLQLVPTEWVLSLDADYVCTPELISEITALPDDSPVSGYSVRFQYWIYGQPLRGSAYPPRTVLYRRTKARYEDDGHGHRVLIDGIVRPLSGMIRHDDRKPLMVWLAAQERYATAEAEKLIDSTPQTLNAFDRLRRSAVLAPVAMLLYCLIGRGLLLEGWRGWFYTLQRTYAEILIALHLLEQRGRHRLTAMGDQPAQ